MDKTLLAKIDVWIDSHADEYIADIQAICRIPSISRADLAAEGAPFGPECRRALEHVLARAKEFGLIGVDHAGYAATAHLGDENNALGILAHIDVVPEGDGWLYPPYDPTVVGDYLIGRGVSDDKGPAMSGLYLLRMMKELNIPLRHGLCAFFGCSEETGMQDLKYYIRNAVVPKASIVPDSAFPVCIAQKGSLGVNTFIPYGESIKDLFAGLAENIVPAEATALLTVSEPALRAALDKSEYTDDDITISCEESGCRVAAHGVLAHAADPGSGKNALRMLMRLLSGCEELDETSLKAVRAIAQLIDGCFGESCDLQQSDKISGVTTTNFGMARLIDGKIRFHLDSRLCVTMDADDAAARYTKAAEALGFTVSIVNKSSSFCMSENDPVVCALMEAYHDAGFEGKPYAMGGGTYSRYLPSAVTFGARLPDSPCPAIPASHGGAHKSDECLHIPNALSAMKIYARALLKMDEIVD